MTGPRITEVSLSLAPFIASAGSSPDFNRIGWIAPPFPESWRTVDSGLRFPSVQVTYLMTVIQFCGMPSTLPLTNQLQPSTSKTDKKSLCFHIGNRGFFSVHKISYKRKNRRTRLLWCDGKIFANVWFWGHSADFDTDWHTLGTRWHTTQLFCIIIMQKTLQTRQTFELFSPKVSLSGIFLIAKLTLVYPCKPLENGLSRILYTWILLDVFLTFVCPKDVIRLKIRLFILRHVLPCQTLQY